MIEYLASKGIPEFVLTKSPALKVKFFSRVFLRGGPGSGWESGPLEGS